MAIDRRDFIKTAFAGSAALSLAGCAGDDRSSAEPRSLDLLVLGGTGFIGPYQIRYALSRGHNVTMFNRGQSNPDMFPELERLIGDRAGDLTALERRRWDAVIDNSATDPDWVRASAGLLADSVDQYLFVSSTGVYYPYHTPGADEALAPNTEMIPDDGSSTYGVNKALSEGEAESAFPGRAIVVRPHFIAGPDDPTDRFTSWPVRLSRGTPVIGPGTPADPVQFVDVRDVTEFMVTLIEEGHAGVYNAAGPALPTGVGPFIEAVQSGVGVASEVVWIDDLDFLAEQRFQAVPWIPPSGDLEAMAQVSNAKALEHGLQLRPIADTARDTIEWWNQQPEERREELAHGPSEEREAEIIAEWRG
ncbi:MAG: NAD-dependent epimerase/dehydratase family protein [Longimicrobiales bacterium]